MWSRFAVLRPWWPTSLRTSPLRHRLERRVGDPLRRMFEALDDAPPTPQVDEAANEILEAGRTMLWNAHEERKRLAAEKAEVISQVALRLLAEEGAVPAPVEVIAARHPAPITP